MGIFSKRKRPAPSLRINCITREVIETISESAKDVHPLEFAGALKARGDVIDEVVLIPGTISGDEHAILRLYHLPPNLSVVGSVHSHPSPYATPSDADLQLFGNFGRVHIIMAEPYDMHSWRAYNSRGQEIVLEVV